MQAPIDTHEALASAIAPLSLLGHLRHPAARKHMLHVAQALETVRCTLETRSQMAAMARLRAIGVTASRLLKVADRWPRGPLQGLFTEGDRAAAHWASGVLEYGWHSLAATSQVACGMGVEREEFAQAAQNVTLLWIACGRVPRYLTREWQVFGGVIDTPLLQALSDLGRSPTGPRDQPEDSRSTAFAGSLQDTQHQIQCMADALLALDLRLQETAWMLSQLSARLDPLGKCMLSALDVQHSSADGRPSDEDVYARIEPAQYQGIRAACAAMLDLAHVALVDGPSAPSAQGGSAVVKARRLLLSQPVAAQSRSGKVV
ncbi:hypothetical protein [Acidovorax sp. PRC11]|uniref:hypothetical protein n=1 Tax=Acidovorax sp. PRC11 TaxID=2962592 RepID=UPI0028812468|nr:hypothetical protein [Acidovorax sp. PRC11]MDT0140575.1 hypothetical protein [Acidovorax sp. PRC11]